MRYVIHYYKEGRLDTRKALAKVRSRVGVPTVGRRRYLRWTAIAATVLVVVGLSIYALLRPSTVTLTAEATQQVYQLSDGTVVTLSPHSSVSYASGDCRHVRLTGKAFAYLKIAEGCAHRCAYCAIPLIRGKYRSRPMRSIVKEARALVESGCRELNIVAQDPMLWNENGKKLPDLLKAIDRIKGDFWVRVLYSYPSEISEDFLVWMLTSPHAVRYIDVPLQHTVPEVLVKMNRKAAIDDSLTAAEFLRDVVPGITLRTTIMTGFPGETEARFRVMMSDLRRMQFDHLGAFAYSPEKGTKGAKLAGRPSRAVAEKREKEVMGLAKDIWKMRSKRLVGQTFRALVVAPGVARMESQAPDVDGVTYLAAEGAMPEVGEFVDVKIAKVKGFDFIGEVVGA